MPPKIDDIEPKIDDLEKYFNQVAKEIKADKKGEDFTPEQRAMFLELSEHLAACKTEIKKIEQEAFAEFEKEKAAAPEGIKNLSKEQIAQILESKKRAKLQGSEIARTLFVIACASDTKISECLEFAEQMGVKDLSSFDLNTGLSPLAAAMLRRKENIAAMRELQIAGADISTVSLDGKNIAHMAALFGVNKDVIKYLVEQGKKANINLFNVKDRNGFTALDIAVGRRDAEFIKYLQTEAGAKFAFTPLDVQKAALAGDEAVRELATARVASRKIKGKYLSENPEEEATKANVDKVLELIQKPLFDVMSLSGSLSKNALSLEEDVAAVVNDKSSQQQLDTSGEEELTQEQGDAERKRGLEQKTKDQREQEQMMRLLNRSSKEDMGPDGFSLLRDLAQGFANLAHVVSAAADVISHSDVVAIIEQKVAAVCDESGNPKSNNWTTLVLKDGGVVVPGANSDHNKQSSWQQTVRPDGSKAVEIGNHVTAVLDQPSAPASQGRTHSG